MEPIKSFDPREGLTEEEAQRILEDHMRQCRENQKQKDAEAYMVKKELIPKYTLSS